VGGHGYFSTAASGSQLGWNFLVNFLQIGSNSSPQLSSCEVIQSFSGPHNTSINVLGYYCLFWVKKCCCALDCLSVFYVIYSANMYSQLMLSK